MFALALCDCFVHFFKSGARRAGEKTPFFFLQSFFFWGYLLKRKSVKGILVSIDSAINYRYQDFLAAFLCRKRRKEKLTKETPSALTPRRRHYSWRATFKKVDKTIRLVRANTPINPISSYAKKIAITTATAKMESNLSSTPPCPGKIVP